MCVFLWNYIMIVHHASFTTNSETLWTLWRISTKWNWDNSISKMIYVHQLVAGNWSQQCNSFEFLSDRDNRKIYENRHTQMYVWVITYSGNVNTIWDRYVYMHQVTISYNITLKIWLGLWFFKFCESYGTDSYLLHRLLRIFHYCWSPYQALLRYGLWEKLIAMDVKSYAWNLEPISLNVSSYWTSD